MPAPASSSSTSDGSARALSIATMFAMCAENVLRLAEIDCSSPMSAKTVRNTGICDPPAAGISSPACAISDSSPAVLSATVLPPVFGPVMTSTRAGGMSRTSTGTGHPRIRPRPGPASAGSDPRRRVADAPPDRGDQQRVPRAAKLEPAVGGNRRLDAVDQHRELRARLEHVELGGRRDGALEIVAAPAERVGQRRAECGGPPPLPAARARRCRC